MLSSNTKVVDAKRVIDLSKIRAEAPSTDTHFGNQVSLSTISSQLDQVNTQYNYNFIKKRPKVRKLADKVITESGWSKGMQTFQNL